MPISFAISKTGDSHEQYYRELPKTFTVLTPICSNHCYHNSISYISNGISWSSIL